MDIKITRGSAPAAGFEADAPKRPNNVAVLHPVARERTRGLNGNWAGLQPHEALAVVALRVETSVAYDAFAIYGHQDGVLQPKFVTGDDRRTLGSLSVAQGEGLIGWVAETAKPILNGNPSVDPGYSSDGALKSALALPLQEGGRVLGVMTLYRRERDAFGADELVDLLAHCDAAVSLLLDFEQTDEAQAGLTEDSAARTA